jgi:Holliday junction resolvasome RuvABC ATP-dependent DNA helicase subunit
LSRGAYRFRNFIGHRSKVEPIIREVRGAKARGVPASHMILFGPSGVGKSLFARSLAEEFGTNMLKLLGDISATDLLEALGKMKVGDFLFLDEAHNLSKEIQELLYQLMESGPLVVPGRGEPFQAPAVTVVLATDKPGLLENALHKRIPTELHLDLYGDTEMKEIVEAVAGREDLLLTAQAANQLARVCNGLPRRAEQLLHKLRFYFPDAEEGQMGVDRVGEFLKAFGIDAWGFGEREHRYLHFLCQEGSASVATLASVLGVDPSYVERQVEPKLRHHGLVHVGASGRRLTRAGEEWVGEHLNGNKLRRD